MSNVEKYLNEAVDMHQKLLVRFIKANAKLEKARNIIMGVDDEVEKIQKQMKKHGVDGLVNPQGTTVLEADEEYHVWDAMA